MILHTHEWGDPDAPPLVCLHGVTGHGERFRRLAEKRWAAQFRVVAPDLRGHGRSGWEPPWTLETHVADLIETADALGIHEADWVGHSFGGRLVLELAAAHPERVRRAVLLDPAIDVLPHIAQSAAEDERAEPIYTSLEDYAEKRLRLGRASLYRYLQIYEWVRKSHGGWLAKHPKGFIPDLSDAFELIWIEKQLENPALGAATRAELEAMRRKALAGELTQREFDEFRRRGQKRHDTLGAVAASLRAIRRRAAALDEFPAQALRDIDEALDRLKSASGALARVAVLAKARGMRLSEVGRKSLVN